MAGLVEAELALVVARARSARGGALPAAASSWSGRRRDFLLLDELCPPARIAPAAPGLPDSTAGRRPSQASSGRRSSCMRAEPERAASFLRSILEKGWLAQEAVF